MSNASSFISKNYDQMRQHVDQVKHRVVPSLADLGQLMWEDLNMFNDMNDTATNDEIEHEIIMFHAENKKPEKVSIFIESTSSGINVIFVFLKVTYKSTVRGGTHSMIIQQQNPLLRDQSTIIWIGSVICLHFTNLFDKLDFSS